MWNFIKSIARAAWNGIKSIARRVSGFFSKNAKILGEVIGTATSVVKLMTDKPMAETSYERVTTEIIVDTPSSVVREHYHTTTSSASKVRVHTRTTDSPGYSYGRSYVRVRPARKVRV